MIWQDRAGFARFHQRWTNRNSSERASTRLRFSGAYRYTRFAIASFVFYAPTSISVPFTFQKRFHRGSPSIFRNNDSALCPLPSNRSLLSSRSQFQWLGYVPIFLASTNLPAEKMQSSRSQGYLSPALSFSASTLNLNPLARFRIITSFRTRHVFPI